MMRKGFTLIELLIVITVIILLISLLMPALGMVRAQANKLKCASNMRNIAVGIMAYRSDNNDSFPGCFAEICSAYSISPSLLICPVDGSRGRNPNMGRQVPGDVGAWGDYSRLYYLQLPNTSSSPPLPSNTPTISACSYDYECSGWTDPSGQLFNSDDISYFYHYFAETNPSQVPAAGTVSWAQGKLFQQQFGNIIQSNGQEGFAFPAGKVPMVRCYYHQNWGGMRQPQSSAIMKVLNISLEGNYVPSSPTWEHDVNPLISLGN
jgi:prepilin-type N-terminal cleavage/methylation domain-containing protein